MSTSPKILVIATNYGAERDELLRPVTELRSAGFDVVVAAPTTEPIQTLVMDAKPGEQLAPDTTLDQVRAGDFDILVVPGGTLNADALRVNEHAQQLIKAFAASGKPVASICHGPWLVAETGLAKGKTLTSYQSIRTDVVNAGADWVDRELVVDDSNGWKLITSRTPNDLDAFIAQIKTVLSESVPATH